MSSILGGPGWKNRILINEKIKMGDSEYVIPGWGPGKEAKTHFKNKFGEEVPTGRYGSMRRVGKTAYREAELAFARYCAFSLGIAESVIATKHVKEILRGVTLEQLQEKGYDNVQDWINGWIEYASQNFDLQLSANAPIRAAVANITQDIEEEIPDIPDADEGDVEDQGNVFGGVNVGGEQTITDQLKESLADVEFRPQSANKSEDQQTFTDISFISQQGGVINYIRLKDVPAQPNLKALLRDATTGASFFDTTLNNYISEVEVERNGNSTIYKPGVETAPVETAPEETAPEDQDDEFEFELPESRMTNRQQNILTEQMRIARKQHLMKVEQRYQW